MNEEKTIEAIRERWAPLVQNASTLAHAATDVDWLIAEVERWQHIAGVYDKNEGEFIKEVEDLGDKARGLVREIEKVLS